MISSLGKAYGVTGGVIAGNLDFINTVKSIPNYVSAAGMNPAFAQTIPDAADIYLKQFEKLKQNLKFIHINLKESSLIDFDVNYPILYPKQEKINEILNENNIVICISVYLPHVTNAIAILSNKYSPKYLLLSL